MTSWLSTTPTLHPYESAFGIDNTEKLSKMMRILLAAYAE